MAKGWKHDPSPVVFPRPNPPRVGKGKATGFLRVLQEASERHRGGKAGQDITLPLPNPKPITLHGPEHVVMAVEVEDVVGRWSLEGVGNALECNANTLVPRVKPIAHKPSTLSRVVTRAQRAQREARTVAGPGPDPDHTL